MLKEEEDGDWITVNGSHIFIPKGEDKDQAVKDFIDRKPNKNINIYIKRKILDKAAYLAGLRSDANKKLLTSLSPSKRDFYKQQISSLDDNIDGLLSQITS